MAAAQASRGRSKQRAYDKQKRKAKSKKRKTKSERRKAKAKGKNAARSVARARQAAPLRRHWRAMRGGRIELPSHAGAGEENQPPERDEREEQEFKGAAIGVHFRDGGTDQIKYAGDDHQRDKGKQHRGVARARARAQQGHGGDDAPDSKRDEEGAPEGQFDEGHEESAVVQGVRQQAEGRGE